MLKTPRNPLNYFPKVIDQSKWCLSHEACGCFYPPNASAHFPVIETQICRIMERLEGIKVYGLQLVVTVRSSLKTCFQCCQLTCTSPHITASSEVQLRPLIRHTRSSTSQFIWSGCTINPTLSFYATHTRTLRSLAWRLLKQTNESTLYFALCFFLLQTHTRRNTRQCLSGL